MHEESSARHPDPARATALAQAVVQDLDDEQRSVLFDWAQELVSIRASDVSRAHKAVAALRATARRETMVVLAHRIYDQLKKAGGKGKDLLWDDRGWPSRLALSGITVGVAAGGTQAGAGIAALGSAIGVPLWLLTASGGAFLGTLVQELQPLLATRDELRTVEHDWVTTDAVLAESDELIADADRLLDEADLWLEE